MNTTPQSPRPAEPRAESNPSEPREQSNSSEPREQAAVNSDIMPLPHSGRDVQEGVAPLTPVEQLEQLNHYFEDHYPEIFRSLTTDEGAPYVAAGEPLPAELISDTERMWARVPDLLTHSSLLVLGAGLDHTMPGVAQIARGTRFDPWSSGQAADANAPGQTALPDLPEGVRAHIIRPSAPTGALAISLHGGPGWFGSGDSHEQLWLPLFAALAEVSGTTIVDLTYPLPTLHTWEVTRTAVATAIRTIADAAPALLNPTGEAHLPAPSGVGLVAFGSGLLAAADALAEIDYLLALSPRIAEDLSVDLSGTPVLLSVADYDSRGTSRAEATAALERFGAELEVHGSPAEHIIAAPAVWRARVEHAGQWLRRQGEDTRG